MGRRVQRSRGSIRRIGAGVGSTRLCERINQRCSWQIYSRDKVNRNRPLFTRVWNLDAAPCHPPRLPPPSYRPPQPPTMSPLLPTVLLLAQLNMILSLNAYAPGFALLNIVQIIVLILDSCRKWNGLYCQSVFIRIYLYSSYCVFIFLQCLLESYKSHLYRKNNLLWLIIYPYTRDGSKLLILVKNNITYQNLSFQ